MSPVVYSVWITLLLFPAFSSSSIWGPQCQLSWLLCCWRHHSAATRVISDIMINTWVVFLLLLFACFSLYNFFPYLLRHCSVATLVQFIPISLYTSTSRLILLHPKTQQFTGRAHLCWAKTKLPARRGSALLQGHHRCLLWFNRAIYKSYT